MVVRVVMIRMTTTPHARMGLDDVLEWELSLLLLSRLLSVNQVSEPQKEL